MSEMDSIVNEFLVESYENLDRLDQELVQLEDNPTDIQILSSIFRTIHTIKGTCGFLGFSKLESIAHVGESLLSKLRDRELDLNPDRTSALLAMVDAIRQILGCLESDKNEGEVDYSELVKTLTRLQGGSQGEPAPAPVPSPAASPAAQAEVQAQTSPEPASSSPAAAPPKSGGYDSEMEPIVNEFLTESYENLDKLDQELVSLEDNPGDKTILSSIFRTIHTIKGTCGFLGFSKLESVAHVGESLLSKLRDGELSLDAAKTSALLSMVDAIRQILACLEKDKNEGDVDYTALVKTLTSLLQGGGGNQPAAPATAESAPAPPAEPAAVEEGVRKKEDRRASDAVKEAEFLKEHDDRRSATDRRAESRGVADTSIRVDVNLLDTLMNLVGELVLARNQILQFAPTERDTNFLATTQHLNLVTTELQEGVMKTRMQPIGNIWSKFPRVVRDLAISCGKKVRLEMEGKETELDKTLIEAIKDPLTHIVRNSVDHGIEAPEVRAERGKPEEGVLRLRAYHEGGQVNIEIVDDGGGIDPERLKQKAVSKGIVTADQASRMGDRELVNLIFAPGFSTAEKVTNVSGRGVGMDVVKTNIEKIGGTVDIQSRVREGTTLKVKIPLTLAIIPALVVRSGGNRYAIPQVNLLELVRLDGEQAKKGIERIQGTPVYRLRGRLLPLVYLAEELKVSAVERGDTVNIVVLQADDRHFGLVVEGISDTEEIVVKPLGKQLKGTSAYAGATIMGDGTVALILDVMGLAQKARVVSESHARKRAETGEGAHAGTGDRQTLLIVGLGVPEGKPGEMRRMAIPLSIVARLEEFTRSEVERSGGQDVVQYRNEIMPLVYVNQALNGQGAVSELERETLHAVVYTRDGKSVGLVVDRIQDIVEESIQVKRSSARRGIVGTVVVQGKVTDLMDVEGLIRETDNPNLEGPATRALIGEGAGHE